MRIRSTHFLFTIALFLGSISASAIRAYFDYRVFHIPGQGPYVEFVTSFDGTTFAQADADSGYYHSKAELTLIVTQGENVLDFRKITVDGPYVKFNEKNDFMSLERFSLPNGVYTIEIEIRDVYANLPEPERASQKILIDNLSQGAFFSDIEFISAYTPTTEENAFSKSGYDMLPYISSYFPSNLDAIIFYTELYQLSNILGDQQPYAFYYSVQDKFGKEISEATRIKRQTSALVSPQLHIIDITKVPSGDYYVVVEARDKTNKAICSKRRAISRNLIVAIDPANQVISEEVLSSSFAARFTDRDSLYDLLQAHLPIAKSQERNTIDNTLPTSELKELQSFLYSFWYKRNSKEPEKDFLVYEQQVKDVQSAFGTRIKKGWQTDRGRVYLQYGPPSTRIQRPHDPDYFPFEIWHYYETKDQQHDRRFLFVNTTLGPDYELMHSDVPQEAKNNDWPNLVKTRTNSTPSDVSRNSNQQFRDPYSGDELQDLWYNPH